MWTASFASNIGSWMQNVVLPVYILDRTGSTTLVGLVAFAQLGPLLFLSIPAGVIADRFDRRRWLMAMQLVQLAFSALLAPLVAHNAPLWAIFAVAFGVGAGNALNSPAWSAMLPTLVSPKDLPGSVSLNSAMINGSRVVGPILVVLLRSVGASIAEIFIINAVTYLFVVFALLRTRVPTRANTQPPAQGWRLLTSGLDIARRNKVIGRLLLTLFTFSLVSLPYIGFFAAVARENFNVERGSTSYEWLYATWGFGACMGGLAIGTVFVRQDKRRLIRHGFVAFAVTLTAFALARTMWQALIAGAFLGFAYFGTTTSMATVLQTRLSHHERGRVMALWFMAFGGTVPLGNLLFAPLFDTVGARWLLIAGAAWALLLSRWCNIEHLDASAHKVSDKALETDHAASFDEHGYSAGE
ncbi:MAG: MFS transporter [Actinomycetia bacterium]|nr:MFS transporter [Actinomycetes bacterium]